MRRAQRHRSVFQRFPKKATEAALSVASIFVGEGFFGGMWFLKDSRWDEATGKP